MPDVALHDLLGTTSVTRVVSRIKTPMSRFQTWLGFGPRGANSTDRSGKVFLYDIFDKTRSIAQGRAPHAGPGTAARQIVGQATIAAYRVHEKIILEEERLLNTRPVGGQFGSVDKRGQAYVAKQSQYLTQRVRNSREFITSRMLRGQFQIKISGDTFIPVDTGGHITVNYKIPSTNKSQLNMIGGGNIIDATWATNTTNIPQHLLKINQAFEQLHGYPLRHVWMNSTGIFNVMNNTKMQSFAGTANRVFESFATDGLRGPDGNQSTGFTVRFNALPWVTFHVYDGGLDVDGTFTKFIPDDVAIFLPDMGSDMTEWINGSEVVAENVYTAGSERFGMTAWTTRIIDPAAFELKALDLGIPVLYLPKTVAYGTVVF